MSSKSTKENIGIIMIWLLMITAGGWIFYNLIINIPLWQIMIAVGLVAYIVVAIYFIVY